MRLWARLEEDVALEADRGGSPTSLIKEEPLPSKPHVYFEHSNLQKQEMVTKAMAQTTHTLTHTHTKHLMSLIYKIGQGGWEGSGARQCSIPWEAEANAFLRPA